MQNPLDAIAPHHAMMMNFVMGAYIIISDGERCHTVMVDYLKRYNILDGHTISAEQFAALCMKYFLHNYFSEE